MREELSEYLDGLQEHMPLAFWKLAEIFQYQVFELCEEPVEKKEESGKIYLIPYMMNDAIEDYLLLLRLYRRFLEQWLTKALTSPNREQLYEIILRAMEAESATYAKRDYGTAFHREIEEKRRQAEQRLIREGFAGTYPKYHRGELEIIIVEEHPFTVMEWDHFQFRIYYMVSQVKRQTKCCNQVRNRGFFRGRGRKSWIFTEDGENVADRIRKKR